MKLQKKFILTSILSILYFVPIQAQAATSEELSDAAPAVVPLQPAGGEEISTTAVTQRTVYKVPVTEEETQTRCRGCLLTTGRFFKKAQTVLETDILPML